MHSLPELKATYLERIEMEDQTLAHLRLIIHNARLVDARKESAIVQIAMAQKIGISQERLRDIENLRALPTEDEMAKIACILEKPIDYLFPEELIRAIEAGVFSKRKAELAAPEIISLTEAQHLRLVYDGEAALIEQISRAQLVQKISEVLKTLDPREAQVVELRFGFSDGESLTLEEVGRRLGVTRERIRQIETKAMRKLRHPTRSRKLKDYL